MITFLQISLLILAISIIVLLYRKLVIWWIQMKKFQQQQRKPSQHTPKQALAHKLVGTEAPDIQLNKLHDIEGLIPCNLKQIHEGDDMVLVFMDKECIHCSNNFEVFINQSKHQDIKFIVVMEESQLNSALNLYHLYDKNISIFLTDEEVFKTLRISFFPAFMYISRINIIMNVTPVPAFAFKHSVNAF